MKNIVSKFFNIIKAINPFNGKDTNNKLLYIVKILLTTQVIYFITLLGAEALIIGISMIFGYNATDHQLPQNIIQIISFFGYIIPIIAFIVYTKKITKSKPERIGLDKNFKPFIKGTLIGITTLASTITILILFGAIKFEGLNSNINWSFIILFFFAFLSQSGMEEVICRGFIFHRLKEKVPLVFALAINVGFFMVGHITKMFDDGTLIGITGIINAVLIGLIFTILTIKDKNIYSAIGFHWIWNFALASIIGLNLSGNDATNSIFQMEVVNKFLTGYSYGIESSFITTIILIIILLLTKRNVRI